MLAVLSSQPWLNSIIHLLCAQLRLVYIPQSAPTQCLSTSVSHRLDDKYTLLCIYNLSQALTHFANTLVITNATYAVLNTKYCKSYNAKDLLQPHIFASLSIVLPI